MSLAHWEIEHGATVGQGGKVIVNDQDITADVRSFQLTCVEGEVSTLTIWHRGQSGSIKGEGVVQISSAASTAFEDLDPEEIEAEALSRQGWGSDKSMTATILDVIKEMINAS
jgi:hypothetical protein